MTAEIAVMNKLGIALAADSAGTVKTDDGIKTYASNKLFVLSKIHPVGLMINGNSALMGIPLELIIKNHRNGLGDKGCDTLEEYASELFAHLDNNTFYFPLALQRKILEGVAFTYYELITNIIDGKVMKLTNSGKKATTADINRIVLSTVKEFLGFIYSLPKLKTVPNDLEENVLREHDGVLSKTIKKVFKKLPLSDATIKDLKRLIAEVCVRDTFRLAMSENTGIVVAGFGEKEIFPSLVSHQIEMVIDGHLKRSDIWRVHIDSDDLSSKVMAFAQREMVTTFLHGVSDSYKKAVDGNLNDLLKQYSRAVIKKMPAKLSQKEKQVLVTDLKDLGRKFANNFHKKMLFEAGASLNPVLEGVQFLPLEELALMAESLVNLTSFRRRVSMDMETVGGPIDVAVISKGDGFIWIKRKHYFDMAENPHFLKRYYK